jgi:quinolinate synthase
MPHTATSSAASPIDAAPLAERHAALRQRLGRRADCVEWALQLPIIDAILRLKQERGATLLAHTYQAPEIFHGVADITGDSLALAPAAVEAPGELLVVCGVHFMAESVKLLAPGKTVLIPDLEAGCSLADAISAEDVRQLRRQHPGVPVVCYVNTSAAVKAECDACCTSANAVSVVESMGSDQVIFVPDRFLGAYVASQTQVRLLLWQGSCEVHEKFTARQARQTRDQHDAVLLAHPECPPEVLAEADFVGSTSAMSRWIERAQPRRVALVTECTMADNLRVLHPNIQFVQPCQLCPHMQRITLPGILNTLRTLRHPVEIDAQVAERARRALHRMLSAGRDAQQ